MEFFQKKVMAILVGGVGKKNDSEGRNMEVRKENKRKEGETLKLICFQGLNQEKFLSTLLWSHSFLRH